MANAYHYINTFDDPLAAKLKGILSLGFDPRQLEDIQLWLDASSTSTILMDENSRVYKWLDRSGLNNHAIQNNVANRPLFSEASFNGKDSIEAVDVHYMSLPHFENISAGSTVFAVLRTDQDNSANTWGNIIGINYSGTEAERQPLIYFKKNDTTRLIDFSAGNIDALIYGSAHGVSNGDRLIATYKTNGSTMYSYINGGQMKSAAVVFSKVGGTSRILSSTKGSLAELIIYRKPLDNQNRQLVEAYLSAKWNITLQS